MSIPYDYYPAVLYAINVISQGETKTSACDQANISIGTFEQYLKNDKYLREMYDDAERRGYDAMADALVNIDNHRVHGQSDPKMAKVISDNIKWLLSKRKHKEYGDRVEINHTMTMDAAITSALEAARNRTAAIEDATSALIDVTPSYVSDDAIMDELLS